MLLNSAQTKLFSFGFIACLLSSCYHPPYNNFRSDKAAVGRTAAGATVGALAGSVAAGTASGTLIGGVIGGGVGLAIGVQKDSKKNVLRELQRCDIEYVNYGDTHTLIVPTDKYFMFGSPRLNELLYPGLMNIVKLLRFYPQTPIYVAGFTDNVGTSRHKRLITQAQAETMMTFLWANNIKAHRLKAEGYGDKNDISDNELIHGSAQNRRIEIQWFTGLVATAPMQAPMMYVK